MEIDWSEVSKNLGTRLTNTIIELEQWMQLAKKLHVENESLKGEKETLTARVKELEEDPNEASTDG